MRECGGSVAPAAEGVNVEEAALEHGASGAVEFIANRTASLVHDRPAFLSMPWVTGKMTDRADDTCFLGMCAGGAVNDKRERRLSFGFGVAERG